MTLESPPMNKVALKLKRNSYHSKTLVPALRNRALHKQSLTPSPRRLASSSECLPPGHGSACSGRPCADGAWAACSYLQCRINAAATLSCSWKSSLICRTGHAQYSCTVKESPSKQRGTAHPCLLLFTKTGFSSLGFNRECTYTPLETPRSPTTN